MARNDGALFFVDLEIALVLDDFLDEVAAHLDPKRRSALFARLEGRGQVWMTATEAALFAGIGEASRFHVQPGQITPA